MSKKKVISLISIAVFVVLAISASVIFYSIANRENSSKDISSGLTNRGSAISGNMEYITNIDRIIENSYKGETFNIVEILPAGVTNDALSKYVSTSKFKSYVIDANREGTDEMKANMISHQIINVNSTTALTDAVGGNTLQSVLDSADLIYISSPNYASYTGTGNMSEDVYNWLHNYALASYKPVIMDYVTQSSGGSGGSSAQTYASFVNAVSSNYIKYRTFYWNVGRTSADEFFNSKNDSYYLKYNVNLNNANGKVLVLSNNGGGEGIQTLFEGYNGIIGNAYYGRDSGKPSKLTYEVKTPAGITAADLSGYDFVILENSIMSTVVDDSIYTALKALSETSKYIIYDKKNISSTSVTPPDVNTSNYLKLMDLLISNKGVSRYVNVLPVSYGFFSSLNSAGEDGKEAAKNIADLINSSDYRGSMTSGANGKVFRVLELQPCYPIDMDLALTKSGMTGMIANGANPIKGNYYTNPSQVLSGVSEDQVDESTEYYKFELSKAKIIKATGLKYSQIQIDQMSTEAFISDKDVVLETYDLVYIGGNMTAMTPYTLKSFYSGNYGTLSLYQSYSISKYLTSFDMYTHTGNVSQLFTYGSNTSQNAGDAYGTIPEAKKAGLVTNMVLNGNDLTLTKLNELTAYIDAEMPILFSDQVSGAYEKVADKSRLEQLSAHDIDPDSRMFKLLKYAKDKSKDSSSIVWNMDIKSFNGETEYNFNEDNVYGPAVTNYVTLFTEKTNKKIEHVILDSTTRPSLKIVSKPKDYIEGNTNTYNVNENGTMTVKASAKPSTKGSSTFDLKLYIDQDGNGTFTEKEKVSTAAYTYIDGKETSADLTYTFEYDDFFGLVSWKVVAAETGSTGACDVATGYAYYKRNEDTDKKDVNILQIMPMDNVKNPSDNYGESDGHSLYLCTECQMAKYRAKYNLSYNGDVYLNTSGVHEKFRDIKMGLHEHKFGIVKFDTAGLPTSGLDKHGSEDWDSNFADVLAEDYNFNTDVLLAEEVQEYSEIIANNAVTDADGNTVLNMTSVDEDGNALGTDTNPVTITWVDYYTAKADDYYSKWESAKAKLEASGTKKKLEDFLKAKVASGSQTVTSADGFSALITPELIQQWINHEAYYRFFYYYGYTDTEFNKLYQNWVDDHDKVVENRQAYVKYSCLSNTSDEWLYNNYDVVVLGFAEDFGGKDLSLQNCADIKSYVGKGGTLLTTHDSTSRYESAGAVNLTAQLRTLFGMDRFHVTGTADDGITPPYKATEKNAKELVLKDTTTGNYYGPVYLTDKSMTADIVLEDMDFSNIGSNASIEKIYDAYKLTEGAKVNSGDNFNVTFNIYDTAADAEAGNKTTTNHSYQVCYFSGWGIQYLDNITISGGTGSYNQYRLDEVSISGLLKYRKYTTEDPNLYYFTELSTIGSDTLADRVLWQDKLSKLSVGNGGTYYGIISPIGMTDAFGIFETTSNNSSPYKYVEFNQQEAITWNKDLKQTPNSGTNRASQNNTGIVTTYPFTISSELRISGTHTQSFALDLEQEGIAVWYTLAGSDSNKSRSSLFAASPYDGMDSYFLYSYYHDKGVINYCGAGHTVVTGPNRDNNDERRLYINIIVNAVRNKGSKPKITVHEKDKSDVVLKSNMEDTNPIIDEAGNYTYNVNSKEDTPEFDYKIKVNSQTKLAEAYVFYDLNYAIDTGDYSNKYKKDDDHVLLYHYKAGNAAEDEKKGYIDIQSATVTVGKLRQNLFKPDGADAVDPLKLKPEYFDPYGNYTYIVIWAKDQNGKTSFQRIKINLIPHLFDLTDAEFDTNRQYIISYSFRLDISDRSKYNI